MGHVYGDRCGLFDCGRLTPRGLSYFPAGSGASGESAALQADSIVNHDAGTAPTEGRATLDQPPHISPSLTQIAGGGTRTHTLLPELDFESSASADSATPARRGHYGVPDWDCQPLMLCRRRPPHRPPRLPQREPASAANGRFTLTPDSNQPASYSIQPEPSSSPRSMGPRPPDKTQAAPAVRPIPITS